MMYIPPRQLEPGHYDTVRPYQRYPTFVSSPDQSSIYVFDADTGREPHVFTNSERFEEHLSTTKKPRNRVVSICSVNSMRPLRVTFNAIRQLINQYEIGPAFLDLALSFGDKPQSSNAGHGGMTVIHRDDGSYDIQYLFTYAEDYNVNGRTSWTIRQVCVFHRYDPSGSENLWILLHAKSNSKLQQHVEAAMRTQPGILLSDWFSMHSLILSTYLPSWRWCIAKLGQEIETTVDAALTFDSSDTDDSKKSLLGLLKPQYLGDKLLPLSSRLGVALDIVQRLEEFNTELNSKSITSAGNFQHVTDETKYQKAVLQGYLNSISVLEKKVQGISDLLAVSLNLNYQAVTVEINNKMLKLTNAAIHDNATVKVVTLVTLIYLPASFVSTLLGMNLFDFDGGNDGGEFTISRQFWIFVIVAVPLTLLTLASWYLITQRRLRLIRKHKISDAEKAE
ncbi:hypothetical protein P170DRAFT_438224 [Aspergillus steynii IBT 23096]|uniref:CorA-like transporter domain-containing protein n=1 Tax=Aspergillus steynii IBT 23096 TaxID=1392250 RepID=A0A2I2G0M6_9EURO|nr:uncharacterized protein P170DRAFT_438224 [Aspergillus steynii IBT 23096]PLB46429.1 hypothetical protein P170DRAFT_438224 [Aspergillus steynii IBT 23096]